MKAVFIALFIFNLVDAYPTAQSGEILLRNGDTLIMYSTPLEAMPGIDSLRSELIMHGFNTYNTGCWRGYIATWELENDSLFLIQIKSPNPEGVEADLSKLFHSEYKDGRLYAQWYTGTLAIQKGKLLHYVHSGFESIFEYEEIIKINAGRQAESKEFHNKVIRSDFWKMKSRKIRRHTYGEIDYDSLPPFENMYIQTCIGFSPGPQFSIDTAYTYATITWREDGEMKGDFITDLENPFIKETIRVARKIPSWDYYERRGERLNNSFSLVFNGLKIP